MKNRISYFLCLTVLTVFTLYLVPHEVVHIFYDHHDTEHAEHSGETPEFSTIHVHCDFLSDYTCEFIGEATTFVNADYSFSFITLSQICPESVSVFRSHSDLRGPPSFFA